MKLKKHPASKGQPHKTEKPIRAQYAYLLEEYLGIAPLRLVRLKKQK